MNREPHKGESDDDAWDEAACDASQCDESECDASEWDADESDEDHPPSDAPDADPFGTERPMRELQRLAGDLSYSMIELEKIPRRLWKATLAPLRPQQRSWVVRQVGDEQLRKLADDLAFALLMAEGREQDARARARFKARRAGHPLPSPGAAHATTRSSVQVNIRLRRDDHAKLAQAAAAVGFTGAFTMQG